MGKPILCVDFDGVIHSYASGWKGATIISDPPVKGALQWLWKATEWWDVQIYSSRSKDPEARGTMLGWMINFAIHEFGPDHPMSTEPMDIGEPYPITFAHEKPAAFLTIDDRAICFDGDWSSLDPHALLSFKPWNKREIGPTGNFPQGVLNDDDEGELQFGVARDPLDGLVHVKFGKPVAWFALPPEIAINFARLLLRNAGAKKVEVEL